LHTPAASQLLVPLQLLSSWLATTFVQVPAAFAHDRQGVVHAFWQQVPSAQNPLAHSFGPTQAWPVFFLQTPLASHVLTPLQKLSSTLDTTVVHVPLTFAQLRHGVVHVSTQQ
jgi:hypothetical protein